MHPCLLLHVSLPLNESSVIVVDRGSEIADTVSQSLEENGTKGMQLLIIVVSVTTVGILTRLKSQYDEDKCEQNEYHHPDHQVQYYILHHISKYTSRKCSWIVHI